MDFVIDVNVDGIKYTKNVVTVMSIIVKLSNVTSIQIVRVMEKTENLVIMKKINAPFVKNVVPK